MKAMKIMTIAGLVVLAIILFGITQCKTKPLPVDLTNKNETRDAVEVTYNEKGGIKTIPVELDGVTMEMIFDTGCSDVLISVLEAQQLYKNGTLNDEDFTGLTSVGTTADGSIMVGHLVNLKTVQIGGENGVTLRNIDATISENIEAPLLIGNGVFNELASVEVDNIKKVIRFKKY